MALTISPAVSGSSRKWIVHSVSFLVGAFLGAMTTGILVLALVVAMRYAVPEIWARAMMAAVVSWLALRDLTARIPVPFRNEQVPEWLRDVLPPGAVALAFGFQLGTGFLTQFTSSAHTTALLALPFLSSAAAILRVLIFFAVGKTIVLLATLGAESPTDATQRFRFSGLVPLRLAGFAVSITIAGGVIAGL